MITLPLDKLQDILNEFYGEVCLCNKEKDGFFGVCIVRRHYIDDYLFIHLINLYECNVIGRRPTNSRYIVDVQILDDEIYCECIPLGLGYSESYEDSYGIYTFLPSWESYPFNINKHVVDLILKRSLLGTMRLGRTICNRSNEMNNYHEELGRMKDQLKEEIEVIKKNYFEEVE